MAISENTKKMLLASSGGYCQNPSCNNPDLFLLLSEGNISNIYEGAHIVAEKKNGPRGKSSLSTLERDEFENIILLCANCHTTIDKNPKIFTEEILKKWKSEHSLKIKALFKATIFRKRGDLRKELILILSENRAIFNHYGPFSETASKNGISEAASMWQKLSVETVIPNNRKIEQLLSANLDLLNEAELEIYHQFKIHKEGFEYNKLSGNKNADVPLFPNEINSILN